MKIYTKTGDDGTTAVIGGARIPKHDLTIHAIGDVDELNATIGIIYEDLRAKFPPENPNTKSIQAERVSLLLHIQNNLFTLGSELADVEHKFVSTLLQVSDIEMLEKAIDIRQESLPELKNFILPSGSPTAAHCHLARAITRRAERSITQLNQALMSNSKTSLRPEILKYINRLSDLLFVLAREDVALNNGEEIIWNPSPHVRH